MIGKLKKILIGKPPVKMNHEFFGKISFVGGDIPDEDIFLMRMIIGKPSWKSRK
jgi:hypothetical protein